MHEQHHPAKGRVVRLRPQHRSPRRRFLWFMGLLFCLLLLGGALYAQFRPTAAPDVAEIRFGTVELSLDVDGLVVQREQVHKAPVGGKVRWLVEDGQRARGGATIARISDTAVAADRSGLVVYQTDGLEARLNPDEAAQWGPAWFKALPAPAPHRSGAEVVAGEPLFKMVDNLSQGLVVVASNEKLPLTLPDEKLQIRLSSASRPTTDAKLIRTQREGGETLFYLSISFSPPEWAGARRVRATLIFATYTGSLVPRSAIDVRDGRQGIWTVDGKRTAFEPVAVVGGNERELVITTALPPGTKFLRTAPAR